LSDSLSASWSSSWGASWGASWGLSGGGGGGSGAGKALTIPYGDRLVDYSSFYYEERNISVMDMVKYAFGAGLI
jgi:hypothetical protein